MSTSRRGFPPLRSWHGLSLGAILLALCGSERLAAQQLPAPAVPAADTSKAAAARTGADTVKAGVVRADSVSGDSATAYRRFTLDEYVHRVLGPRALLQDVALAALGQALKRPTEWPRTWGGYGNRLSTRLGIVAISQTVVLGVSAGFDARPAKFRLCQCVDKGSRFLHAALVPWEMDSPNGTHLSLIAPASEIGSAILITSLNRRGFSLGDGLRAGAIGLVGSSLVSVAREFWPWHRRSPGI